MLREYADQQHRKGLLEEGEFIYFKDLSGGGIDPARLPGNSGTVRYVDDTNIDIDNVNGDGDNITRRLDEIVLCYDTIWDTEDGADDKDGNSEVLAHDVRMTLHDRDVVLEELWARFGDVPMNPETECMEEEFLHFAVGTHREEIWHWFDHRHSKGVAYLLYKADISRTDHLAKDDDRMTNQHSDAPEKQPIDVLKVAKMANDALDLMSKTPPGIVIDGDTILADIMEEVNFEESGATEELVEIWKSTADKETFHRLFMFFTGCDFEDFLEMAIKQTTRPKL